MPGTSTATTRRTSELLFSRPLFSRPKFKTAESANRRHICVIFFQYHHLRRRRMLLKIRRMTVRHHHRMNLKSVRVFGFFRFIDILKLSTQLHTRQRQVEVRINRETKIEKKKDNNAIQTRTNHPGARLDHYSGHNYNICLSGYPRILHQKVPKSESSGDFLQCMFYLRTVWK